MRVPISFKARQRLRQHLHNIEDADEILDALNELIESSIVVSGNFSSENWETIFELEPNDSETLMITFSVIGRASPTQQAGLKRTAVFFRENGTVIPIDTDVQQVDFTSRSDKEFDARLLADGAVVKLQVKSATSKPTQWRGSIEVEKLGE